MIAIITMVVRIDSPLVVTLNDMNISGTMDSRSAAYRSDMPKISLTPSRFAICSLFPLMGPWSNHRVPLKPSLMGISSMNVRRKMESDLP
jgi:hypothetical protein